MWTSARFKCLVLYFDLLWFRCVPFSFGFLDSFFNLFILHLICFSNEIDSKIIARISFYNVPVPSISVYVSLDAHTQRSNRLIQKPTIDKKQNKKKKNAEHQVSVYSIFAVNASNFEDLILLV